MVSWSTSFSAWYLTHSQSIRASVYSDGAIIFSQIAYHMKGMVKACFKIALATRLLFVCLLFFVNLPTM